MMTMGIISLCCFTLCPDTHAYVPVRHLMHKLPAAVGEKILLECQRDWNGAFQQGWCVDQKAQEWIDAHDGSPRKQVAPEILIKPPDIIIRPEGDSK
jgi:hypothetical protein